jgi:hypothetical protein
MVQPMLGHTTVTSATSLILALILTAMGPTTLAHTELALITLPPTLYHTAATWPTSLTLVLILTVMVLTTLVEPDLINMAVLLAPDSVVEVLVSVLVLVLLQELLVPTAATLPTSLTLVSTLTLTEAELSAKEVPSVETTTRHLSSMMRGE